MEAKTCFICGPDYVCSLCRDLPPEALLVELREHDSEMSLAAAATIEDLTAKLSGTQQQMAALLCAVGDIRRLAAACMGEAGQNA